MPRTFAAMLSLLAALTLLPPGEAIAGPPDGASGKMVFDEVADGLRKYHAEKCPEKRAALLRKLAPTRDPRIGVALLDSLPAGSPCLTEAHSLLAECFVKGTRFYSEKSNCYYLDGWREKYEPDLRRRAAQLPR